MNDLARDALKSFFSEAPSARRFDPVWYIAELKTLECAIRDRVILGRAAWIWATHDKAALMAKFERLLGPEDQWGSGFSFDISDSDGDEDDWLAAYQMAIDEVELSPPEYPDVTMAEIESWLAHQPRRVKPGRPVQMSLWL